MDGQSIITESGTKIPLGNHKFVTGEAVWTDGQYVFGHDRRSTNIVPGDGSGIIGDYFLIMYGGDWRVYNAANFSYTRVICSVAQNNYIGFYNKSGTRFSCFSSFFLVFGDNTFSYTEITEAGAKEHSLSLNISGLTGRDCYLFDCYYDDEDKPVFIFATRSSYAYSQVIHYGNGTLMQSYITGEACHVVTFTNGEVTKDESFLEGYKDNLATNSDKEMSEVYKNLKIVFTDIIEPSQSDIQKYYDGLGSGYEVTDWTVVWQDEFVADDDKSTYGGMSSDDGSDKCFGLPLKMLQAYKNGFLSYYVKPSNGDGVCAIIMDSDYNATIGKTGFDDGSLDNYYATTHTVNYTKYWNSYYGSDVVVPTTLPDGYKFLAYWSSKSLLFSSVSKRKHLIGNSGYTWQDADTVYKTGPKTQIDSSFDDSWGSRNLVMRTAKITYTLKKDGISQGAKTLYWTRRAKVIDYTPEEATTEPSKDLSQEYHDGWTINYNTGTKAVTATKKSVTYSLGNFQVYFFVQYNVRISETADYLIYTDNMNGKVMLLKKSDLTQKTLSTIGRKTQDFPVIWRTSYARLLYLLNI